MNWYTSPELWERLKPIARELRQDPTRAETALWQSLRNRKLAGLKFRRQHTFERFVLDFYCHEAQLVVEVDGGVHQYTREQDAVRQTFLENQGLRVLRFWNDEVLTAPNTVLEKIAASATARQTSDSPSPQAERGPGGEVPPCAVEPSLPVPHSSVSPSPFTERGLGGEVTPDTPGSSPPVPHSSVSPSPFTERGLGGEVPPAATEPSLPQPRPADPPPATPGAPR